MTVAKKFLLPSLLLAAFLLMSTVGGALTAGMMMEEGSMDHCPYMGVTALCSMSPLEHLQNWQQMFATTPASASGLSLLLSMAAVVFFYFFEDILSRKQPSRVAYRRRYTNSVFDQLSLALASGVLHSKAY